MNIQIVALIVLTLIFIQTTYITIKVIRYLRPARSDKSIFVDTSVLIDGRILMIAEAGFIGGTLIVPRSVVGELQFLADNADHEKRARARHGLDVVRKLQDLSNIDVEIMQDGSHAEEGVDERLLKLAKKYKGSLLTIDFNLNKVAAVENIEILNINELAQKLRMSYLPGEKTTLELVQPGQDSRQGVGYLPDGTMVVVENGSKLIGKKVEVEFIRALQTAAGKMMFARTVEIAKSASKDNSRASSTKTKPNAKTISKASSGRKSSTTKDSATKPSTANKATKSKRSSKRSTPEDKLLKLVDKQ